MKHIDTSICQAALAFFSFKAKPRGRAGRLMATLLLLVLGLLLTGTREASAQQAGRAAPPRFFQADAAGARAASAAPQTAQLRAYRGFTLNLTGLRASLASAPVEGSRAAAAGLVLALPLPDGSIGRFQVVEASIMEPALAARFPEIKTYAGFGLDDATATVRFDLTPQGFHAQILSAASGAVYIDPLSPTDLTHYLAYYSRDVANPTNGTPCENHDTNVAPTPLRGTGGLPGGSEGPGSPQARTAGTTLRVLRLAVATTAEFTAACGTNRTTGTGGGFLNGTGGTQANALAVVTTIVNEVVGIYERELAVRFVLVGNENNVLYTNAGTDPFSDPTNLSQMLTDNLATMTTAIGDANYDIGHAFTVGTSGGLAQLSAACTSNKPRGASGFKYTAGFVNYSLSFNASNVVAHELAHELGATHTFNSSLTPNCGSPNRSASTAYEPGAGSTIMSYSNGCNGDGINITSPYSADPNFHLGSYDQIQVYLNTLTCNSGNYLATGNTAPTVTAPAGGKTIPANTPFRLTAAGSDANSDAMTFSWEELDLGSAALLTTAQVANDNVPLFRVRPPVTSPIRYFPQLSDILANTTTTNGDKLPTVSRSLNFRCAVRDQHNGSAGVVGGLEYSSNVALTVDATNASPFAVTFPNTAVSWAGNSTQTVTWNVVGTNAAPVNCATVNILLSTDGGSTYPTVLVANTANDGSQSITVPNLASTTARVMVEAADNYFLDISNANFTITSVAGPAISGLFPASGPTGTSVTITGSGFTGTSAVKFGGVTAAYSVTNATTIAATVPALAQTGNVTVTNGTTTTGGVFTVTPTVQSVNPTGGGTGISVVISGTGFGGATLVSFNGTTTSSFTLNTAVNPNTITVTVPNGASTGAVVVTTASGVSNSSVTFTVVPFTITTRSPVRNGRNVSSTSAVGITFAAAPDASTAAGGPINIFSSQRGGMRDGSGTFSSSGNTVTFTPSAGVPYRPGEVLSVTTTSSAGSTGGATLTAAETFQFTVAAGAASGALGTATHTAVGNAPKSVAVGDVNGDGFQDAVTANTNFTSGNTVSVRLGDGAGGFGGGSATLTVGSVPQMVVLADVNNDGRLDIVVSCSAATAGAYVLVRNATGSAAGDFGTATSLPASYAPVGLAVGDFNNDGWLDVATVDGYSNAASVHIYLNAKTSTGTFGSDNNTNLTGGYAVALAAADFNNDGNLDLLVSNGSSSSSGPNTVTAALGNGAGGFSSQLSVSVGTNPAGLAVGDVNEDGNLDFATANQSAGNVSVRLGNGAGSFTSPTTPEVTVGSSQNPQQVALTDLNGDGHLDIIATNYGAIPGRVSVRLGAGNGSFSSPTTPEFDAGSQSYGLAVADVNSDGRLDVLTSNTGSGAGANSISTLLGLPAPVVTSISPTSGIPGTGVTISGSGFVAGSTATIGGVALGSPVVNTTAQTITGTVGASTPLNAQPVVVSNGSLTSNTNVTFTVTAPVPTISSFTPAGGAVGTSVTITGTGFTGATVVTFNLVNAASFVVNSSTQITAVVGAGTTTGTIKVTTPGGTATSATAFVLLSAPTITSFSPASGAVGSTVTITGTDLTGTTSVRFGEVPAAFVVVNNTTVTVTVPRLASTHKMRLTTPLGTALTATAYAVTRASSSLTYAAVSGSTLSTLDVGSDAVPTFADVDGDGRLDLVIGEDNARVVHYQQSSTTSNTFALVSGSGLNSLSFGSFDVAPAVTDLDGDGLLDLLVATDAGLVRHYRQNAVASTAFTLVTASFNGIAVSSYTGLTVTDVDGNGRLDLLVVNSSKTIVRYEQSAANSLTFAAATALGGISASVNWFPTVADVDGNGLLDLVVGYNNTLKHYEQSAVNSLTFAAVTSSGLSGLSLPGSYAAPVFSDVDGDGLLDLVIGYVGGTFSHLEQVAAPTALALSNNTLAENVAANTTVGTLSSTDATPGATFTYTLVVGSGSGDNAAFNISGNALRITASPNFEAKSSYAIRLRTTNNNNQYFEQTFTVSITDVAEAPTAIALTPSSVAENVAGGTTVGTLSSTDPEGGTFTYAMAAGGTDNAAFTLTGSTISINASPDFETKSSYSIKVRSTDQSTLFFEQVLTVTITDVAELPTIAGFTPATGPVGTVITVTGTNLTGSKATGTSVRFGEVPAIFTVNANGTQMTVTVPRLASTQKLNIRTVGGTAMTTTAFAVTRASSSYNFALRTASFGGISQGAGTYLATSVADVDSDGQLDLLLGYNGGNVIRYEQTTPTSLTLGSPATLSSIFATGGYSKPVVTDLDGNGRLDLLTGNFNGNVQRFEQTAAGAATFAGGTSLTTDGSTAIALGTATLTAPVLTDLDGDGQLDLLLGATDGKIRHYEQTTLNGLNFAPAGGSTGGFLTTNGTTAVGVLSYSIPTIADVDGDGLLDLLVGTSAGDVQRWEQSAAGSTFFTSAGQVTTNGSTVLSTGVVIAAPVLTDLDNNGRLDLLIGKNDGTVSHYEQAGPPSSLALSNSSLNENVPAATAVGTFSSTDPDGGTFTYTLVTGTGNTDNATFTLTSAGALSINASPNFEAQSSYSIRVRTTNGSTNQWLEQVFIISITDMAEAPTAIALTPSSVAENVAANTTVGTLSSTDPDAGNTFTYALVTGGADNGSFTLAAAGVLTINASPNYEVKNSYAIRVRTTDQGTLFFEQNLTVNITNVNEAPTALALSNNSVAENVAANSTVGTFSSTDPDAGNTFTYTLAAGGTDNASFTITGTTLTINASPNFEAKSSYAILVRTTDQNSLFFDQAFTINITNVNEAPTGVALSNNTLAENVAANTTVGTMSSTDPDASNTFTYALATGGADNASFTLTGAGTLTINASPDFETKSSYAIRVRTTDQGSLFFEQNFTVNITNVVTAISNISPNAGIAGTTGIVITGTDLSNATAVTVNGASASITANTATAVTFTVPAGASNTQSITVTTPGGTPAANTSFTVLLQAIVAGTSPAANALTAPVANSAVAVTFTEPVSAASLTGATSRIKVFSSQVAGLKPGTWTGGGTATASFTSSLASPRTNFRAGEVVNVTVPATVQGAGGLAATKKVYQFTAAVTGPGSGLFQLGANLSNPGAMDVTAADFNGDGILDLADTGGGLQVRFGTGSGTYGAVTTYGSAAGYYSVTAGDLDGDGDLDLVLPRSSNGTIAVMQNNGGVFTALTAATSNGGDPRKAALGDIDGDGDLDMLVPLSAGGGAVGVYVNTGSGGFLPPVSYPGASNATYVALGDVDNDGDLDYVVTDYSSSRVVVRLNSGSGTFPSGSNVGVPNGAGGVALGDVNGDGALDIVTSSEATAFYAVSLNTNAGTGSFAAATTYPVPTGTSGVALGDVDSDGDLDVMLSGNTNGTGFYLRLNNSGVFSGSTTITAPRSFNLVLADLDNDNDLDLVGVATGDAGITGLHIRLNVSVAPTLTAVAPNPGGLGQSITLTGTNLGSPTALTINGASALSNIISNSGTSLVVRVPTTATASGNVSITTAGGGPVTLPFSVMAAPGNALAFDGVDDYVALPITTPVPVGNAAYTVEAWVNPNSMTLGSIIGWGEYGTNNQANGLSLTTTGLINYWWGNDLPRATPSLVGHWHHVAATYDGTTRTLYLDGVALGSDVPGLHAVPDARNLRIGSNSNGTYTYLNGRLDEVRVYSVALTAAQLQADMTSTTAAVPASLVLYYNFDQGTPATASTGANTGLTTVYDLTNGYAGTLTNFASPGLTSGNTTSNWVESYALVVPALAASAITATGFTATWTAPALGTVDNGYVLDVATDVAFSTGLTTYTVASGLSKAVTGLAPGTPYYARVRADKTSVTGQGAYSTSVTVITPSNVSSLSNLVLSAGSPLTPAFASGTLSYTLSVPAGTTTTTVTPTRTQANATITVNGTAVTSGSASGSIALAAGTTTNITVIVTAQDGTTQSTYTVAVTRPACVVTALAQNVSVALDASGNASTTATAFNNGSTANCGFAASNSLVISPSTFTCADVTPNAATNPSLNFNGSTQYVEGTHPLLPLGNAARTIETWVYVNSGGTYQTLFNYGTLSAHQRASLLVSNTNKLFYSADFNDLPGNITLSLNAWHHVAATYDGTTLRLYVDGVADASRVITTPFNTTGSVWRMAQRSVPLAGELLNGRLDEVRVWARALTAAEVTQSAARTNPTSLAGLVARWGLNEGSGTTTADAMGNGTAGTTFNSPTWTTPGVAYNGVFTVLTATDAYGNTARAAATTTVNTAPTGTLTNLSPNPAFAGQTVTATGTNLSGATALTVNGVATTISGLLTNGFTFVVPSGGTNTGNVVVTAPCSQSITRAFSILPAIAATGLSPTSGPVGTPVTITGTNLGSATSVSFNGGTQTTITSNTATSLTVNVPASATTGTVTVTTASGTSAASAQTFTVTPSLSNLVLSAGTISPAFASGTTSYTLTVPGTTTTTTVTPTNAQTSGGTITVNGTAVSSGAASGSIALVPGSNTITIVVNPNGAGTARTYTVTVTRTCTVTALAQNVSVNLDANGNATVAASAVNNGSSSTCGAVTLSVSPSSFTCANVGTPVPVTLTVTDSFGGSNTASATVTVQDVTAPLSSQLPAAPALATTNVPEAAGYGVLYQLDIPNTGPLNNLPAVPYTVNKSGVSMPTPTRVAYFMELESGGVTKWVWASMDNFASTLTQLGVPHPTANPVAWHQNVTGLNVASSAGTGLTTGTGLGTGRIEMAPSNYGTGNGDGVPGANAGAYDFGDDGFSTASGHGSFQLHNVTNAQTIFGYNAWGAGGAISDLGIGTQASGSPDWTFANNASSYTVKRLYILVPSVAAPTIVTQPATVVLNASGSATVLLSQVYTGYPTDNCGTVTATVSPSTFTCTNVGANTVTVTLTDNHNNSVSQTATVTVQDNAAPKATASGLLPAAPALATANIPEAAGYGVLYQLDVPNSGNFNNLAAVPYTVNNAAAAIANPTRVAYFMELTNGSGTKWVWASMNNFASTLTQLGIPHPSANPVAWHQNVTGLNVFSSAGAGVTTGTALGTGRVEMWPSSYGPSNDDGVPGANSSTFDFGDGGFNTTSGHGSFQVHNLTNAQTVFGYNAWGNTSQQHALGIGNYPSGDPDWTFAYNAASYTVKRIYILVPNNGAFTQSATVALNAAGTATVAQSAVYTGASDNCGVASVTVTPSSFSCADIGTRNVSVTVTDVNGNASTQLAVVTVQDNTAPTALAQSQSVSVAANGRAYLAPTAFNNGSSDNCGLNTLASSASMFGACGASSALVFDGNDDYATAPHNAAYTGLTALTLEAWIRTTYSGEQYITTKNDDTWYFAVNGGGASAGKVSFYLNGVSNISGGGAWLAGATTVSDGVWHHVAATYDGTALRIYVDGVLDASRAVVGTIQSGPNTVVIGARPGWSWNGSLDELRIWNTARTAAQLALYKDKAVASTSTGLLAYYDFNDGAGSGTLTNRGPVGGVGTLTNFGTTVATAFVGPGQVPALGLGAQTVTLTASDNVGNVSSTTATVTVSVPAQTSVTWTGATSTDWTDCRNWSYGTLPSATISALLPAGMPRYPSLPTGTYPTMDLTLASGATLATASTATLQVSGSFANNGGTASLAGPVSFIGTATSQTVGGSSATSFATVTVNKANGSLTLGRDLSIGSALTMTSGILTTGSFKVALANTATISETDASYVSGAVETTRALSTAGSGSSFGGLGVTLTPAASSTALPGSTLVRRVTGSPATGVSGSSGIGRYFVITPTVDLNLNVTLALAYFDHELNGIAENRLKLFKSENGAAGPWARIDYATYNASANTVTRTNIASLSTWTLGNADAPLPVELLAFTAQKQGPAVQLKWQTASERNSDRFEVERSRDGRTFERIGTVAAKGNTTSPSDYGFLDSKYPGETNILYYRLHQFDTDGSASYSPVRAVQVGKTAALLLYPNPARSNVQVLGASANATIEVFDAVGRLVTTATADADGTAHLALPAELAPGVYMVRSGSLVRRLTVE